MKGTFYALSPWVPKNQISKWSFLPSSSPSPTWVQRSFASAPKKPKKSSQTSQLILPKGVQNPSSISVRLNHLADNPGARRARTRVGRGAGSRTGKTAGRGSNGQRSRTGAKVAPQFEGGTTPLYKRMRKYGFSNAKFKTQYEELNLDTLQYHLSKGRLDPSSVITMRHLKESGAIKKISQGVKILSRGHEDFHIPVHLEVSQASKQALLSVEKAGGSIKRIFYTQRGLQYILDVISPWVDFSDLNQPIGWKGKGRVTPRVVLPPLPIRSRFDAWGIGLHLPSFLSHTPTVKENSPQNKKEEKQQLLA